MGYRVIITDTPGWTAWRTQARLALNALIPPTEINWVTPQSEQTLSLFEQSWPPPQPLQEDRRKVPAAFMRLASYVACHQDPDRFNLLYRILWRITREDADLIHKITDPDMMQLIAMYRHVKRDAYKMTAFLRFRESNHLEEPWFIAWYEPIHYTLELSLPFFQTRFVNMRWSILTPYLAAHWDGEALRLDTVINKTVLPQDDTVEDYWVQYYATTFNPARLSVKGMCTEMPRKYWKNMPETRVIHDLVHGAAERVEIMIRQED